MSTTINSITLWNIGGSLGSGDWSYYDSDVVTGQLMARVYNNTSSEKLLKSVSFYLGKGHTGTADSGDTVYSNGNPVDISFSSGGKTTETKTISADCPLLETSGGKWYWEYCDRSGGTIGAPNYVVSYTFSFGSTRSDWVSIAANSYIDLAINCSTAGSALVRYKANGYASAEVEDAYIPVTSVSFSVSSKNLCTSAGHGYDNSFTLTATISPTNATNKEIKFSSSNYSKATIDNSTSAVTKTANSSGQASVTIKGVGKGDLTITATAADSNTDTCDIRVYGIPDDTVTIISPTGTGKWYGGKFKILFRMPADTNVSFLSDTSSYKYRGITVKVENNTYTIANNSGLFSKSLNNIGYRDYVVMDYNGTISSTTTIKVTADFAGTASGGSGINAFPSNCTSPDSSVSCSFSSTIPSLGTVTGNRILSSIFTTECDYINKMVAFVIPSTSSYYKQLSTSAINGYILKANTDPSKHSDLRTSLHNIYRYLAQSTYSVPDAHNYPEVGTLTIPSSGSIANLTLASDVYGMIQTVLGQ